MNKFKCLIAFIKIAVAIEGLILLSKLALGF